MRTNNSIHKRLSELLGIVDIDECNLIFNCRYPYYKRGNIPEIGMPKPSPKEDIEYYLKHELGHLFFDYYYGDIICEDGFEELFGDHKDWYTGPYWFHFVTEYLVMEDLDSDDIWHPPEYLNAYSQTHPLEDFCECFVEAINSIIEGVNYSYGNRTLNKKINFVKKCIKKV